MERYCGYLQAGLRSRSHPWANLNNRILHKAYLDQIDIYYDLEDDLTITSKSKDLRRGEKVFDDCQFYCSHILCFISRNLQIRTQFCDHHTGNHMHWIQRYNLKYLGTSLQS